MLNILALATVRLTMVWVMRPIITIKLQEGLGKPKWVSDVHKIINILKLNCQ